MEKSDIILVDDDDTAIDSAGAIIPIISAEQFQVVGVCTADCAHLDQVLEKTRAVVSERTHAIVLDHEMNRTTDGQLLFGHQIYQVLINEFPELAHTRTIVQSATDWQRVIAQYRTLVDRLPSIFLAKPARPEKIYAALEALPLENDPDGKEFMQTF